MDRHWQSITSLVQVMKKFKKRSQKLCRCSKVTRLSVQTFLSLVLCRYSKVTRLRVQTFLSLVLCRYSKVTHLRVQTFLSLVSLSSSELDSSDSLLDVVFFLFLFLRCCLRSLRFARRFCFFSSACNFSRCC